MQEVFLLKVDVWITQGNTTMILLVHLHSRLLEYHIIERPDLNVKALGTKMYHSTGHFYRGTFTHLHELSSLLSERFSVNLKCVAVTTPISTMFIFLYAAVIKWLILFEEIYFNQTLISPRYISHLEYFHFYSIFLGISFT